MVNGQPQNWSNNVDLVECADDTCMWMVVTMKRQTTSGSVIYTRKLYYNNLIN